MACDLPRGLVKRLYGSIVLLDVLNENVDTQSPKSDLGQVAGKGPSEIFHCFVDKIAHICDVKHGGDSVTAVAVLQPGCIEYRLSSNSRSDTAFTKVKKYLTDDILGALGKISDETLKDSTKVDDLCSAILLKVLAFNRWRIYCYVKSLVKNISFCIDSCVDEGTPEGETERNNPPTPPSQPHPNHGQFIGAGH